jgi:hypothetical protein
MLQTVWQDCRQAEHPCDQPRPASLRRNASIAAIAVITASGLATMVSRRGKPVDGMGFNVQNTGALGYLLFSPLA